MPDQADTPDLRALIYVYDAYRSESLAETIEHHFEFLRSKGNDQIDDDVIDTAVQQVTFKPDATVHQVTDHYRIYIDSHDADEYARPGRTQLLNDAKDLPPTTIVINDLLTLSESLRDVYNSIELLATAYDHVLHVIDDNLRLAHPTEHVVQKAHRGMLRATSKFEASHRKMRALDATLEQYNPHHGRPPLGFDVEAGELTPADDYDDVCTLLQLVVDDELSRRKAADRIGCARRTINRALNRPDMYHLEMPPEDS